MNLYQSVKKVRQGEWSVKLGPGILPITVTQADLDFFDRYSNSTIWPNREMGDFLKLVDAVALVRETLES